MTYEPIYPGKAKGPPNDRRLTFKLPRTLDAELRCLAVKYRTTRADLIRRCLWHGIAKVKNGA